MRAESDHMIRSNMKMVGAGIGEFAHLREPTTPDNQPVIRMNQDTLYSGIVLDMSKPATITLPEVGGRYMSMHVVNQDHYMFVESKPGTYELTEEKVRHALRARDGTNLLQRRRVSRKERPRPQQLQQLLGQEQRGRLLHDPFRRGPEDKNYLPITKGWNYVDPHVSATEGNPGRLMDVPEH